MCHPMKMYRGLVLAGALFLLAPALAWAQAAGDVDCNKCVDAGDIDKKAVKKKNLAKGTVDSSRIADGAVKAKDLADGAVEGSKLAAGAVTGGKLADGAVSGAKLASNAVDGSKLAPNSVGSGKLADGAVTVEKLAPDAVFGRVIVVRADPADQVGNCVAVRDTLAGITDNDADNRYTVLLEPGIYDCGATPVEMKDFVDLQGSGRGMTEIKGSVGASIGLVVGANSAELRRLTVDNGGGIPLLIGILALNVSSFEITDVTAIARDAAIGHAIEVNNASVVLSNVTVQTSAIITRSRGIRGINNAVMDIVNVAAGDADGLLVPGVGLEVGSTVTMTARNSVFRGTDFAVSVFAAADGSFVSSQLDGGTDGVGSFACVDSYDGIFAVLMPDCS